jgi:glycosyltransferase involved in cell wall biosynthesis
MGVGIKYISYPDHSGYGLSALAYVRALHNAGVPVWWAPLIVRDGRHTIWSTDDPIEELPLARDASLDASLQDVIALTRAAGPKPYDTVIFHTVPEHWQGLMEAGKRNVGYTVWETDRFPDHWPPALNLPERILVPCTMNQALFEASGLTPPVRVVPHIRRHAWNYVSPVDVANLRQQLGIPEGHFVFHTIGTWDPRKALSDLITVFASEFSGHDRVSLVVKTSSSMHYHAVERLAGLDIPAFVEALKEKVREISGRTSPHIVVVPVDGISGRAIDTLHALGDCFVSLTHGEGWGMGAFEAACLGKPILITGYGGQCDYLGMDYPGLIPYAMTPVSGWLPEASFQPPQRWAQADLVEAGCLMRRVVSRYGEFLEAAESVSERLANQYAEPVVAREFLNALDD